jgi:hypothetical protein
VVDLDMARDGEQPPAQWSQPGITSGLDVLAVVAERAGQPLPLDTRTVTTPSGGLHLYYAAPSDVEYRNTAGRLGWHIDTRAHGGYVVAPGSVVDGCRYGVTEAVPVAELPAWLGERLRPTPPPPPVRVPSATRRGRYLDAAVAAEVARVEGAAPGERNQKLYEAAVALGQLVAGGCLTEQDVRDALIHAAAGYIAVNPSRVHRADGTITSGLKAGARRPRQVAA